MGSPGTALSLEITGTCCSATCGEVPRRWTSCANSILIAIDDFRRRLFDVVPPGGLHVEWLDRLLVAPVLDDARVATVVRTIIGLAELG